MERKNLLFIEPINFFLNDMAEKFKEYENEFNKEFERMRKGENLDKPTSKKNNEVKKNESVINKAAVNISSNDKTFDIQIIAPGFNKSNIDIQLKDNILIITGEKESKSGSSEPNIKYEYELKSYFKEYVTIPDYVNLENIKAKFENGVLDISLEIIQPEIKKRKIDIE